MTASLLSVPLASLCDLLSDALPVVSDVLPHPVNIDSPSTTAHIQLVNLNLFIIYIL